MTNFGRFLVSLYVWILVGSVTFLVSSLILLSAPLIFIDPERRWHHGLGTLWAKLLLGLNPYWKIQIKGAGELQKGKGYVLVANHASLSDIVCLFTLDHPFKWLAKQSLFSIPFFGWAMSVMGYIPLVRGQLESIKKSYAEAMGWLKKNVSVLIFPEGTRSRTGEMGRFKRGAFRLAIESGHPLVPIVLAGTQDVISKGRAAFGKPCRASMTILPPLETKNLSLKDEEKLRARVESLMQEELKKQNQSLTHLG